MTLTTQEVREIAQKYTRAWCSHDPDIVASFYAEDGKIVINDGEPSSGRAGVAQMAEAFYADFPNLVIKMDGIRSSGTHAIYLWTLHGTNTGPGGRKNHVVISGWEYWQFAENGLIAESRGHFDAIEYQRQLDGT